MDWGSVTFDWTRVRAFLVTAEEGSLSAAARALNLTQPTLGRQVAALEDSLGLTLFTRAGRRMDLTPAGRSLLDHARAMGNAAAALSLAAEGHSQTVAGDVTVTASDVYAAHLLPPVVARLKREAPGLRVIVDASNTVQDLTRRAADIALRHVRPTEPDLIARLVAEDSARLYATPACLAPFQPISAPADLNGAPFIGYDTTETYPGYLATAGLRVTSADMAVLAENHIVQWALCREGLGIGVAPTWLGDADPQVVRVLPDPEPLVRFPVWLVAHRDLLTARRVRLVYDRLAEALRVLGPPGSGDGPVATRA